MPEYAELVVSFAIKFEADINVVSQWWVGYID
jgi:hypothetical protein